MAGRGRCLWEEAGEKAGGACPSEYQAQHEEHGDCSRPEDDEQGPATAPLCPGLDLGIKIAETIPGSGQVLLERNAAVLVQLSGLLEEADTLLHPCALSSERPAGGPAAHQPHAILP
jgi:hypothetical protein